MNKKEEKLLKKLFANIETAPVYEDQIQALEVYERVLYSIQTRMEIEFRAKELESFKNTDENS